MPASLVFFSQKVHFSLSTSPIFFQEVFCRYSSMKEFKIEGYTFCALCSLKSHLISLFIIWLAPLAGKMNQSLHCEWLPERARWSHPARSGLPALSRKKNFPKTHIISPLLTKLVRSRWLDIGRILFFACLLTETNTQKKNEANIQPS